MPDTKRTASGVLGGFAGLVGLSAVAGVLIAATVTPAIALSGAAASSAITMFDNLPSVLEIEKLMLPTTLYYTDPDTGAGRRADEVLRPEPLPVEFDQIAPVMYDAILSSEDKNFYKHGGVDLVGTVERGRRQRRAARDTRGGSSISQQYVKNILVQRCEQNATTVPRRRRPDGRRHDADEASQLLRRGDDGHGTEGIQRKLQEMRYAIALEQKYSKNEILLGYLNIANFGGTNYGIDAAARYYFGVAAQGPQRSRQAATLAGMVQNPNSLPHRPAERLDDDEDGNPVNSAADGYAEDQGAPVYVLDRACSRTGKITQEQHDAAVAEPITPTSRSRKTGCACRRRSAYFCQYVKTIIKNDPAFGATHEDRLKALRRGGLNIYTTLDLRVQQAGRGSDGAHGARRRSTA